MDLRHQARQRFINDVAFGGAGDAETLLLLCECGRRRFGRCRFVFSNASVMVARFHSVEERRSRALSLSGGTATRSSSLLDALRCRARSERTGHWRSSGGV